MTTPIFLWLQQNTSFRRWGKPIGRGFHRFLPNSWLVYPQELRIHQRQITRRIITARRFWITAMNPNRIGSALASIAITQPWDFGYGFEQKAGSRRWHFQARSHHNKHGSVLVVWKFLLNWCWFHHITILEGSGWWCGGRREIWFRLVVFGR